MTLYIVVVDLRSDFWEHGKLYVALSRVKDPSKICILLPPIETEDDDVIKLVSDQEIVDLVCSIENQEIESCDDINEDESFLSQLNINEEVITNKNDNDTNESIENISTQIINLTCEEDSSEEYNHEDNFIACKTLDKKNDTIFMNNIDFDSFQVTKVTNSDLIDLSITDLEEINTSLFNYSEISENQFTQSITNYSNNYNICDYESLILEKNNKIFQDFDDLYDPITDIFNDNFQIPDIENNQWKMNTFICLKNYGRTCYLNSIIQVLSNSFLFKRTLMNSKIHNNFIESFKKIFYDLSFQRKKQNFIVETFDLIQALHLSSLFNFPIDAHEIMIMILNKLVDINCLDPAS